MSAQTAMWDKITSNPMDKLATTPDIDALLRANAPVAIGVSGGKDSCAAGFATTEYLDSIGHTGPRILIHSDLGRVEWAASLPTCERLADVLGLELVVVKRRAGGLMERWLTRWDNNVARYTEMECVKLILPWSTASMRFCTSELKTAIICRDLVERFPGQTIISVCGIRRDESPKRRVAPVAKAQEKLFSHTFNTKGFDWHSIIDFTLDEVLSYLVGKGFALHEAYLIYHASRVSCAFCILAKKSDLVASATCAGNHAIYREMVDLEIASTFSFQDSGWLGDVAPHLLTEAQRDGLDAAKTRAARREAAEVRIPKHLLYTKGWPTAIPTQSEAQLLCDVRCQVGEIVGIPVKFTTPDALVAHYELLMSRKPAGSIAVAPDRGTATLWEAV